MSRSRSIVLPLLLATALVGSVAPASLAQDDVSTSAGVNADRVDGKDAVSATGKKKARAGKLVATDAKGYLPSNILKPLWGLIQGLPTILADGQVSWNELVGIPADLTDGQVGWGEVANKPAGFADGTDDAGVTGVKLTRVVGPQEDVTVGGLGTPEALCPAGSRVTGGGFFSTNSTGDFGVAESRPTDDLSGWEVDGTNNGSSLLKVNAFAVCMTVEPAGAFTTAKKGFLPASVKKALKKRR